MGAEIKDAQKLPWAPPASPHSQSHQTSLAGGVHRQVPSFIKIIKQSLGAGWSFHLRSAPLSALPLSEMYYLEGRVEEVNRSVNTVSRS